MKQETKLIKSKLGLLHLAEHLGNVSQAGRYCFGKTSMETFNESIILARQKIVGQLPPVA